MNRTTRLLTLIQTLRQHRHPVTASELAKELSVSERTIYRDIEMLREQGADIDGEAGVGFWLVQDYALPPMQFSSEELEALVFGMRFVEQSPDNALKNAATSVLAKIHAILPPKLASQMLDQHLYPVSKSEADATYSEHFTAIRKAMREERFVQMSYKNAYDDITVRQIIPLLVGYFDGQVALVAGFCLLRQDFRHFRIDRIITLTIQDKHNQPKAWLINEWQKREECVNIYDFGLHHLPKKY